MSTKTRGYIAQAMALILIAAGVTTIAWKNIDPSNGDDSARSLSSGVTMDARPVAPDFALPDLKNNTVKLSAYDGQVRIVDFWATWCPPCRKEIPHFQALHEKYGDQGLKVIGVALGEEASVVQPFVDRMKMTYTSLLGDTQVAQQFGGIEAIPTTFVIDKKGRVYKKYIGYRDYETFERDVLALMAE
jgi:cytochrome c biogenesis protein CcmG/thiol:disulfide interchange protein DsbE